MAYLGRGLDKISNIEVLDNITFDGSSSYSITKGSVAFTPNSAQSLLISIDGVVQATNFSVNSSTIDFGVAIPSTSVCNFFLHYGTGVMTVPSDGSVGTSQLASGAVTNDKISATASIATTKLGTGAVLQVVSAHNNTEANTTASFNTTGNATGIKASITPSSTSSKILITSSVASSLPNSGTNANKIGLYGLKHNTSGTLLMRHRMSVILSSATRDYFCPISFNYLHSPNSTSSQEYEITFGRWNSTFNNTVEVNDGGNQQSGITLMEISG